MRIKLLCLVACGVFLSACAHEPASASCTAVDKEYASLHARTLYKTIELVKMKEPLTGKSLESMQCGEEKGTIYYYEYPTEEGAQTAEGFIKGTLWGSSERSAMHPDIVARHGSVVVVVSARNPETLQPHVRPSKN